MENCMKKLNFKKFFLSLYCILFIIFIISYFINIVKLNKLKNSNILVNSNYLGLNSKSIKNFAIKTSRKSSNSLVRTKKLQSYVEIGGLELPIQGSTGYTSIKMNLMLEPNSNSGIVSTFVPRNWFQNFKRTR